MPCWALVAAATGTPLEFVYFEYLFCFRSISCFWVVNFISSALLIKDFMHLLLWNKSPMISKSVLGQIFPAMVPHMFIVHFLFLFLPEFQHLQLFLLEWKLRSSSYAGTWATSTLRSHRAQTVGALHRVISAKRRHGPISLEKLFTIFVVHITNFTWPPIAWAINWNVAQDRWFLYGIIYFINLVYSINLSRIKPNSVDQVHDAICRISAALAHLEILTSNLFAQDHFSQLLQIGPFLSIWRYL